MILDRLADSAIYHRLGDRFGAGFDYLRETDLRSLADGRYEIRGENVFAIVQTYQPKPRPQGRWEAHRLYADIQYVVSGVEQMGVGPLVGLKVVAPYDAEKDVEFYADLPHQQWISVAAGNFAVFLPHDVHMPSLSLDGNLAEVKKVVIKVRVG
jgi:YhcH/YjgK/YiaL family protein